MMTKDLDTYLTGLRNTAEPAMPPDMQDQIWARIAAHQERLSARRGTAMGGALVAGALIVGMLTPNGHALARSGANPFAADLSMAPSVLLDEGL